eukprot:1846291-Pyramimonas_sp.AAC.1
MESSRAHRESYSTGDQLAPRAEGGEDEVPGTTANDLQLERRSPIDFRRSESASHILMFYGSRTLISR